MRTVDNYNYLPGCCWICRGVAKPIIDMEQDLDGHNSPDDPNPSAVTRLYICADCGIEIGRMMAGFRGLELTRIGELALANRVATELAAHIDDLENKLNHIASAIHGIESEPVEPTSPTSPTDEEVSVPDSQQSETIPPLNRKRGLPRRKDYSNIDIDTDFLGDL